MDTFSPFATIAGVPDTLPPESVATPAFVIDEARVRHNLARTLEAAGGADRLMPHLKTHRAPWIVKLLIEAGIKTFKAATVAEVEMSVGAGAKSVLWAYPSANKANIERLIAVARANPGVTLEALVDSPFALALWKERLKPDDKIGLRVDLDPGLGRTGLPIGDEALAFARTVAETGRFKGWHVYDGHIKGTVAERQEAVDALAAKVRTLTAALAAEGIAADTIAGGSYTFDLWPADVAVGVCPGSWTYSSAQHDLELPHLGWLPAAFVLATVISAHGDTITLDAGAKAISPDKPLAERFRWNGKIRLMNEEHTIVDGDLAPGTRVLLMPQHACTTAYLYDRAWVHRPDGGWEERPQLGSAR
ncbi:alanine racemase [Acuticoccus kandeliae]|uniref:alanine racemase n=1 Tax=Acuticoccus kandeliae TaxID=2073160 RepID=UPI000D3E9BD8|nr:alanine racemase [Acuticoccus kandeliae]